MIIDGVKIVKSLYVPEYDLIKRTWHERLFSLPWHPLKKTKEVYAPKAYVIKGEIIVSYKTYDCIEKLISLTEKKEF